MASGFLNLFCSQCGAHVARYRKEGSGSLLRLYLDRIDCPDSLKSFGTSGKIIGVLTCPQCGNRIGSPMMHEGNRPAYRLIRGSFRRKKDT